jgi:hypothetical protein
MAIVSTRVTVGTTATLLVAPSVQPQRVQLLNAGDEVVRIGGADVTTTAFGLPRLPNNPDVARTPFTFNLNPGESIFGIVAANTSAVNVWIQTP